MAFWNRKPEPNGNGQAVIDTVQLMERYDVQDINPGGYIVVSEKPKQLRQPQDMKTTELGSASDTLYSRAGAGEYNAELRGLIGYRKYDEMRRSDGTVRGTLRLVKTPVLAARWFVEPASSSTTDRRVAEFVQDCLFKYMSVSWPQLLTEILLHLDYGYYTFEKVFIMREGKAVWRKWGPRHPMTIQEWMYDSHGGPNGCYAFSETSEDGRVWLPIENLLVFTNDKEGGNIEGISILRSAYKHWFYADNLYKIDAIQKERHGIGVPVIMLPVSFDEKDRAAADEIGRNLRTNEKAHIVLPPMWEIMTLKLEGQHVNALESAQHHVQMIYSSVLADFMGEGGNPEAKLQLFNKATRFVADQIRDVINKWAIPELVDLNWKTVDTYPELRVRRIGETTDWRTLSFALRNLTGAGIIKPDDPLEEWIRDEMDLPKPDPATTREIATPQGGPKPPKPGRTGQPRQSAAGNMRQAQQPTSGRAGQDQSGG